MNRLATLFILACTACGCGPARIVVTGAGAYGAGERVLLRTNGRTWRQVSGPPVELTPGIEPGHESFTPSLPGAYVWEVSLPDNPRVSPVRATVTVPARRDGSPDRRPVARITVLKAAYIDKRIVLDGSGSTDPDGDVLSYRWQRLDGPLSKLDLSFGKLDRDDVPKPTFFTRLPGHYRFALTVHDGYLRSFAATLDLHVTVPPDPPPSPPAAKNDGGLASAHPARKRRPGPLDRLVTIELRGSNVAVAGERLAQLTGFAIHPTPALAAGRASNEFPVHLAIRKLPVRRVLDWIARQVGARYVIQDKRTVWLTRDYSWLEREKLVPLTLRADALYRLGGKGKDLIELLVETVKPALWTHKNASLSVDPEAARVTAILPATALRRIRDAIVQLRAGSVQQPLPLPEADREAESKLLAAAVTMPRGPIDAAASLDAAAQSAAVSVGYRLEDLVRPDGKPGAGLRWDESRPTLGHVLARVLAATPLTGYRIEDGGIWLYKGDAPQPSRRDLWQSAQVTAIDLRPLAARRKIGAEMLLHMIRRNVAAGSWKDPSTALVIHHPTGRLIVVHHPEIIRRVSAYLFELERADDAELWGTGSREK